MLVNTSAFAVPRLARAARRSSTNARDATRVTIPRARGEFSAATTKRGAVRQTISNRAAVKARAASSEDDAVDKKEGSDEAVANISRKVARTARACKSLGRWSFWSQLVLTTVAAVIVVFSFLYKGLTKSTDAGLYFILFGLVAGY